MPEQWVLKENVHCADWVTKCLLKVKGMKGAIAKAVWNCCLIRRYVMLKQFENPANPFIEKQQGLKFGDGFGKVDAVVAGVGTGGSIDGISRD